MRRRPQLVASTVLAVLLQGCVFVPRTVERYDPGCRIVERHMELEAVQIASIQSCSNSDCGFALALVGATAATSAVVSGSIVIVGNVVYWFEKQGQCTRETEPPS
ncbi:MAG: hypothetical protein GC151_09820 [Betaproteobacteria bacterium]|nr:hypothetical protein [Betaproteobacteria bacterium]